jgi:hypothetical protein
LACYPTTPDNPRADYVLPDGSVVPRMQRGGEAPLLPSSPSQLPVLLFSHGYGGSPLTGIYLRALIAFASWGYVTVAPFHGDLRYSVFGPDSATLGTKAYTDSATLGTKAYIPVWSEFVAMQAIRRCRSLPGSTRFWHARSGAIACRRARSARSASARAERR